MTTPVRSRGLVLAAALALALVGCTATTDGPRAVTTEESQLLATARFNNFDLGSRPFRTTLTQSSDVLTLTGWIDYGNQVGYAAVSGQGDPQYLLWNSTSVAVIAGTPDADGNPVFPIPPLEDPGWSTLRLDPTHSTLEALLAGLSGLGSDRPDNPLLLQQSGALWLREDAINGRPVTVFAAPSSDTPSTNQPGTPDANPSPLRLWVDATGLLLRAEFRLGGSWIVVDLPNVTAPRITPPAAP
ncbi:MAG: hypothetical protein ABI632_00245 [Pseudolysinimonas sp.]